MNNDVKRSLFHILVCVLSEVLVTTSWTFVNENSALWVVGAVEAGNYN